MNENKEKINLTLIITKDTFEELVVIQEEMSKFQKDLISFDEVIRKLIANRKYEKELREDIAPTYHRDIINNQ